MDVVAHPPVAPLLINTEAANGVQSIETGLRLLEALIDLGSAPMLKTLAEQAGMPSPKAHRYLVSFCRAGLVDREPQTGAYRLGPLAVRLGLSALRHLNVVALASPAMTALRDRLGCTVGLAVWGNHGPTFVRLEEPDEVVVVSVRVGTVMPIVTSATGRLFGAYLPWSRIATLAGRELRSMRGVAKGQLAQRDRVSSSEELASLFEVVRAQRMAVVTGDLVSGIHALSAPVFDHAGKIVAALTALGDAGRFDARLDGPVAQELRETTELLSRRMGHASPTSASEIQHGLAAAPHSDR